MGLVFATTLPTDARRNVKSTYLPYGRQSTAITVRQGLKLARRVVL